MSSDQIIVFSVLLGALVLFALGKWRFDMVAVLALLAGSIFGVIPLDQAFMGFGHPAVITVAAVLIVSRGLLNSGVVDSISRLLSRVGENRTLQVVSLTTLVTTFSAFMNNIGALALLLPVAVRMARNSNRSPSFLLMPLAFGSLLGGMTTLIGTPPNIIIATFRTQTGAEPFGMFDFSPVGMGVALGGIIFVSLLGWRLIPQRQGQSSREELFQIKEYVTEVKVPENSKFIAKPLHELENIRDAEITILGLIRGDWRVPAPAKFEILRADDVLIVEADSDSLKTLLDTAQLNLATKAPEPKEVLGSEDVGVIEAVIMPDSAIEGSTPWTLQLRWRYGINVIGVARSGMRLKQRLRNIHFRAGDVLLLQGQTDTLYQTLSTLGCLPLAERGLRLGQPRRIFAALGIFVAALASTTLGLLPVQISFAAAAVSMTLAGLLSVHEVYDSIDWPIIVLLGAMIPVGFALETTGGAQWLATLLVSVSTPMNAVGILIMLLLVTMFLSDLVNNAAATIIMAPIAMSMANELAVSPDSLLMAVAIGASCAFLTPIGHQSNAMVMGPGGYRFGDYWRMGLPLEVIIAVIAVPLIVWVWPFTMSHGGSPVG